MVDILASLRNVGADIIEDSMTVEQISLRYFFYLRERHRDAERISLSVALRLFGKADS